MKNSYIYQIVHYDSGTALVTTSSRKNVECLFKELKESINNNPNYVITNIDDSSSNYYIDIEYKDELDGWIYYGTIEIRAELVVKTGYTTKKLKNLVNFFKNIE